MSRLKELHTQINDILISGINGHSRMSVRNYLHDYLKCNCLQPFHLRVYDSALGCFVDKELPCGVCDHCRCTKVNGWCTRLYAHLEDFKYVYFITLTYRSFTEKEVKLPFNNAVLQYLSDAFWHFDDDNFNHSLAWHPCLCVMHHFSDFLKRLRKNTGIKNLTFFACQEYGHSFGRPHFHALLFSNSPITKLDCYRAWGRFFTLDSCNKVTACRNSKNRQFKSFGRVDFCDLLKNGTLSRTPILIHNKKYSTHACFAYVAKYCGKLEFNKTRLSYAYDYFKHINNSFIYETTFISGNTQKLGNLNGLPTFKEWCDTYAPRINCSRATPIGSLFVTRHIAEMAQGTFTTPPLQAEDGVAFIKPAYFLRKVQDFLYPYRFISESNSFVRKCIPSFVSFILDSLKTDVPSEIRSVLGSCRISYKQSDFVLPDKRITPFNLRSFFIVNVYDKSRFLLYYSDNKVTCARFVYSRSLRDYVQVGFVPFEDFCSSVLSNMIRFYNFTSLRLSKQKADDYYKSSISDLLKRYNSFSLVSEIRKSIISKRKSLRDFYNVKRYQQSNL